MCQLLTQEDGETSAEAQILARLIPSVQGKWAFCKYKLCVLISSFRLFSFRLSSSFALEITFRKFHLSVHNHKLCPEACRRPTEGISLFQALCWHPAVSIPFLFPWVSHRASQVEIVPRNPLSCTCFPFCFFHHGQLETRVFFDLFFPSLNFSKYLFYRFKSRFLPVLRHFSDHL